VVWWDHCGAVGSLWCGGIIVVQWDHCCVVWWSLLRGVVVIAAWCGGEYYGVSIVVVVMVCGGGSCGSMIMILVVVIQWLSCWWCPCSNKARVHSHNQGTDPRSKTTQ
jgi:hypothetical protein